jgi:hypothetical protein
LVTPPILGRFRGKQVHPDKEFHWSNESLFSKKILNHSHNRGVVRILPVICHFDFLQKSVLAIPKCVPHSPSTPSSSISKKPIGHNSVTQRPYTTSDSSASRVFEPQSVGTNRPKLARHNKRHPQRRKGHVVLQIVAPYIKDILLLGESLFGFGLQTDSSTAPGSQRAQGGPPTKNQPRQIISPIEISADFPLQSNASGKKSLFRILGPNAQMSKTMTTVKRIIPHDNSGSVSRPRTTGGLHSDPTRIFATANAPPFTENSKLYRLCLPSS